MDDKSACITYMRSYNPERSHVWKTRPITSFSLLSAFLAYNTTNAGNLPKLYSACTGLVGIWGLWVITFAGPKFISRKTGADKHTSAFMFGNKSSASEQKKLWKREQKGKGR